MKIKWERFNMKNHTIITKYECFSNLKCFAKRSIRFQWSLKESEIKTTSLFKHQLLFPQKLWEYPQHPHVIRKFACHLYETCFLLEYKITQWQRHKIDDWEQSTWSGHHHHYVFIIWIIIIMTNKIKTIFTAKMTKMQKLKKS